jgi:predicted Fe-Mo cluster-binding NifX family protein
MSRIAIPVKDDLLSRSFNTCTYFLIYDIRGKKVVGKKINFHPDDFKASIADWSDRYEISDVIVHYIDETSLEMLSASKINIFIGIQVNTPDRLIEDFLAGTLKSDTHNIFEKCNTI